MATRVNHQDIVKAVLDSKAVDLAAVGKMVAQFGPALSLADEPWDGFCGTMRHFIHIYVVNIGSSFADLGQLREVAGELKGVGRSAGQLG
jgi:hypothetical protein